MKTQHLFNSHLFLYLTLWCIYFLLWTISCIQRQGRHELYHHVLSTLLHKNRHSYTLSYTCCVTIHRQILLHLCTKCSHTPQKHKPVRVTASDRINHVFYLFYFFFLNHDDLKTRQLTWHKGRFSDPLPPSYDYCSFFSCKSKTDGSQFSWRQPQCACRRLVIFSLFQSLSLWQMKRHGVQTVIINPASCTSFDQRGLTVKKERVGEKAKKKIKIMWKPGTLPTAWLDFKWTPTQESHKEAFQWAHSLWVRCRKGRQIGWRCLSAVSQEVKYYSTFWGKKKYPDLTERSEHGGTDSRWLAQLRN